jgi:hypothetical protein
VVTISLAPPSPVRCGDFDVDALVIEHDADVGFGFRLVLGRSYDIFWALPAAPGDRLRLIHVDAAVYHVDEPTLHADPYTIDLPRLRWDGLDHELRGVGTVVAVECEARAAPGSYRCAITVRADAGTTATTTLAWEAPPEH